MRFVFGLLLALGLPALGLQAATSNGGPVAAAPGSPPPVTREFRAAWVATVKNIDWPSRPGLPVAQQQSELRGLIETAARLNLNALILQVRPSCDAFYDSPLEPWSEFLTGRQGQRPQPFWDPLEFAVAEAHARGIELHAWFNPFRARLQANSPAATNHVSRRMPNIVHQFGAESWLDPGESDSREHAIKVIVDVVHRYDIDGVHLDDYFYPYPVAGVKMGFPDDRSWQRYLRAGGRLERDDWRRDNVDTFVRQLSDAVRDEKPWIRFGISPFGIWRPGNPQFIRGMDAYNVIYADSRKWFQSGWVDYLAPQLYWPIAQKEQSFQSLLGWWAEQNTKNVGLWPGIAVARIGTDRNAGEIANQIRLARRANGVNGMLFWNFSSLRSNLGGVSSLLTNQFFQQPALVPELPSPGTETPGEPELEFELDARGTRLGIKWSPATNSPVRRYVLQSRYGSVWRTELLPGSRTNRVFSRPMGEAIPQEIVLTPIGRSGGAGEPTRWSRSGSERPRSPASTVRPSDVPPVEVGGPAKSSDRPSVTRPRTKPAGTAPN